MPGNSSIGSDKGGPLAGARAASRDSMFLQGSLRSARHADPLPLRIRNLSAGGLMGEVSGSLQRGDAVEVELRGVGKVSGHIAWRQGDRTGISFDVEIDPKLARKPVGATRPPTASPHPSGRPLRPGLR